MSVNQVFAWVASAAAVVADCDLGNPASVG